MQVNDTSSLHQHNQIIMTAILERTLVENGEIRSLLGLKKVKNFHLNLPPAALVEQALLNGEGSLTDTGALMADTGEFTGRSPQDRFIVSDEKTIQSVWWSEINIPFDAVKFDALHKKMLDFLSRILSESENNVFTRFEASGLINENGVFALYTGYFCKF